MSQRGVEGLLGRLITDKSFRQRFFQEPGAVIVAESLEVTTRELDAVCRLDEERVISFAKGLDNRIVRAALEPMAPIADAAPAAQVFGEVGQRSEQHRRR